MDDLRNLRSTLGYLETYLARENELFQSAPFLKSDFDAEVWHLDFGLSEPTTIDFRIHINKTFLLTCLGGNLCRLFKMWICAAGTNCSLSSSLSNTTMLSKVSNTISVIDWLLMNAEQLSMHEHGLKLLSSNDVNAMLASGCDSSYLSTTIYSWPNRLKSFLQHLLYNTPRNDVLRAIRDVQILKESWCHPAGEYHEIDTLLPQSTFSEEEKINIRAALWAGNFYIPISRSSFKYAVDTKKIAKVLYKNTLGGIKEYPTPSFLQLLPYRDGFTEFPAAPTRSKHSSMGAPMIGKLISILDVLRVLEEHSNLCPISVLEPLPIQYLEEHFNLSRPGRFASLPIPIALSCLKNAIEFYLKFSKSIMSSYLKLMKAVREKNVPYRSSRKFSVDIRAYLDKKLVALNVVVWNKPLSRQVMRPGNTASDIFHMLRSTPSLHELLQVLFGAIQITLGILQARRASELRKIIAKSCLSADLKSIETPNRKTGFYGINQKITRPIPYIGAQMIRSLEEMQEALIELGFLDHYTEVLSCPLIHGQLERIHAQKMQEKLNTFCDYFQTPLDASGRRHYVRQHQFRRFFAQVFFWHQGEHEDKLDILRWILGHGDSEMIYHYITESTPGQVLRQIKAEWGGGIC